MKKLSRYLAFSAGLLGIATLIPIPVEWIGRMVRRKTENPVVVVFSRLVGQLTYILLGGIRFMAGTFAPVIVALGAVGSFLSMLRRDWLAVASAEIGSGLLLRYLLRLGEGHDGFDEAFGNDWRSRIPDSMRDRMLLTRYSPLMPAPPVAPYDRDVVFGEHLETGKPLLCDLWVPPRSIDPSGVGVIFLHSSGWHVLDKGFGTRRMFAHLASQGHVIMDVAYTMAPEAGMQAMLNDVRRAITWLKEHGPAEGVDPGKIVLMGGSAGGHLASLAAFTAENADLRTHDTPGDVSVKGLVTYYAITDLSAFHNRLHSFLDNPDFRMPGSKVAMQDMISDAIGGTPERIPDRYRQYSSLTHAGTHCPPTLLITGEDDVGVYPPEQGDPVYRALRDAGVPVIHAEIPLAGHAFDLFAQPINPGYQAALYDVERFLALMAHEGDTP